MTTRGNLGLLLLVGAVIALIVWTRNLHGSRNASEGALQISGGSELAVLSNRYDKLDARLARLEVLLGAGSQPVQSGTTPAPPDDPVKRAEQEQAKAVQRQARLQNLFATDPRANDATSWEAVIAKAFSDPSVAEVKDQPSTRTVRCRTRLCEIVATFPPEADGNEWAARISMALSEGFSNSRLAWGTLPSGETGLKIYTFKKGRDGVLAEQGI